MSDDLQLEPSAEEAPAPETALVDASQDAPQADAAQTWEDRAMSMGWTPKGQFRGDPEKWVDAETFVKRGEEFLPFLKANNKRLERDMEKANAKLATMERAIQRSVEHMSRAEQRGYERARHDLEAQLDQAALAGDADGVRAVTKEIVDLEKEVRSTGDEPKSDPDQDGKVKAFVAENPWFEADPIMRAAAVELCGQFAKQGLDIDAQLKATAKRIRDEFPHKFTNPRRAAAATVEGGGLGSPRATKGYGDMPPEARQFCDELVRDKITTRERYVADFFKEAK